jgi:hypothetical protein
MEKKKKPFGTIQNHLGKMSGQSFAIMFEKTKHEIWV